MGAAAMGTVDAVVREWLLAEGAATFVDLDDEAFGVLDRLLDQLDQ